MKKYTIPASLLIVIWLAALHGYCQSVPQGINYQAVARNESGGLLADQAISVKMAMLDSAASGPVLYEEVHALTTNAFGLFNLVFNLPHSLISL